MNSTPKRMRGSNFTRQEQFFLLEEIQKYRDIIENKTTNKIMSHEKLEAWNKVAAGFNSQVVVKQSLQQLQAKYENLKSETRKAAAAQRLGLQGTGGGPFVKITDDPIFSIILDLINYKTDESSHIRTSKLFTTDMKAEEDHIFIELGNVPHFSALCPPKICKTKENQPSSSVTSAILGSMASCSQVSENLKPAANETVTNPGPPLEVDKIIESDNWSQYTPRMLRKPVSKSLMPKVTSHMPEYKENYYWAKTRLKEKQVECLERRDQREAEEHARREKQGDCLERRDQREAEEHARRVEYMVERNQREHEYHKRKMKLMELEIKEKENKEK